MTLCTPIALGRKLSAWMCLLAMALLWTPMWAAVWQTDGMSCCDGTMCAARGHSNANQPQPEPLRSEESPMHCAHNRESGLASCTMSRCQENGPSLTTSLIFVVPEPAIMALPAKGVDAAVAFVPAEFAPSVEPLSPPPRTSLLSV